MRALNPSSLGINFVKTTLSESWRPSRRWSSLQRARVCVYWQRPPNFCANRFVFSKCSQAWPRAAVPVFLAAVRPHPCHIPLTWDILTSPEDKRDFCSASSNDDSDKSVLELLGSLTTGSVHYGFGLLKQQSKSENIENTVPKREDNQCWVGPGGQEILKYPAFNGWKLIVIRITKGHVTRCSRRLICSQWGS